MRIVVSLPDKDHEFQLLQSIEARAVARRLGFTVDVLYAGMSGVAQIQQIYKAIHSQPKPCALVLEPIAIGGLETILRKVATCRIPCAVLSSTVSSMPRLQTEFGDLALFSVGCDQAAVGRLQGEQLRTLLPRGGTALYVHGPLGSAIAEERARGMRETMAGEDIRLIELDGHWTEDSACRSVQTWLRLRTSASLRIDAVVAQDDAMARGARRAAAGVEGSATRWAQVPYLGIDGVPEVGRRMVDQGELTATIVMPSATGTAIEQLVQWLAKGVKPPRRMALPIEPYPSMPRLAANAPRSTAGRTLPGSHAER